MLTVYYIIKGEKNSLTVKEIVNGAAGRAIGILENSENLSSLGPILFTFLTKL